MRAFPSDVYDLSPASFADLAPDLAEAGIAWGRARRSSTSGATRVEDDPIQPGALGPGPEGRFVSALGGSCDNGAVTIEVVHVTLPGNQPPWTATGLRVEAGDAVTLLGSGFIRWSSHRDVGAGAKFHLWGRVPGGQTFGCTQDTTTATVDRSGELELCVYTGAWADRAGNLATGATPYERNQGALQVWVVRWPAGTDPLDGLVAMDHPAVDGRLVVAEIDRLRHPVRPPQGWSHLLDFGTTEIYRTVTFEGRPGIQVVCDDDAGILQRPVHLALDPTTTIEWTWRVDALPSSEAEDTTWTHDYLSIATEFDSGRDLTWFWSASLAPIAATFDCPVRGWRHRETHMPVRSGSNGLGRSHNEVRNVWDDHCRFMGDPPPAVVKVWLIAVSHFGRGLGRATFSDIRLTNAEGTVRVL